MQQRTVDGQAPDVVDQIQTGLLGLVVGQVIGSFTVGVVSAPVLVLVASDGGGDGGAASRARLRPQRRVGRVGRQLGRA